MNRRLALAWMLSVTVFLTSTRTAQGATHDDSTVAINLYRPAIDRAFYHALPVTTATTTKARVIELRYCGATSILQGLATAVLVPPDSQVLRSTVLSDTDCQTSLADAAQRIKTALPQPLTSVSVARAQLVWSPPTLTATIVSAVTWRAGTLTPAPGLSSGPPFLNIDTSQVTLANTPMTASLGFYDAGLAVWLYQGTPANLAKGSENAQFPTLGLYDSTNIDVSINFVDNVLQTSKISQTIPGTDSATITVEHLVSGGAPGSAKLTGRVQVSGNPPFPYAVTLLGADDLKYARVTITPPQWECASLPTTDQRLSCATTNALYRQAASATSQRISDQIAGHPFRPIDPSTPLPVKLGQATYVCRVHISSIAATATSISMRGGITTEATP